MNLTLHTKNESLSNYITEWNQDGEPIAWANETPVMLWKFKDQDNNLWNTETPIDGTEEDAASIILASVVSA